MFEVDLKRTFWWPVSVTQPSADKAGEVVVQTFNMKFLAMSQADGQEYTESLAGLTAAELWTRRHSWWRQVCLDWNDVVDGDKKPIPFSLDGLEAVLDIRWINDAVKKAYDEAMSGKAASKN